MKKTDQRNKAMRLQNRSKHILRGVLAAGISGALVLGLLTACTGRSGEQPTVTDDDLKTFSAAQAAIALDVGNGTNYPYFWEAEDIDAAVEEWKQSEEQRIRPLLDLYASSGEALQEAGFQTLEQAEYFYQNSLEESARSYRENLLRAAALDPVVSAQEAANLAGIMFKQLYGVDLSQKTLNLTCYEASGKDMLYGSSSGRIRTIWMVSWWDEASQTDSYQVNCALDATTGEWIDVWYCPSAQEREQHKANALPACFVENKNVSIGISGYWDAESPAFRPLMEQVEARVGKALSGSVLVGGAEVTEIRAEVSEPQNGFNELALWVNCSNGKTYRMTWEYPYDPYDPIFADEEPEFPLRSFSFLNKTYEEQ